eukprot:TRINITY_DN14957_c0_g1_i1.p2 TRINITY_DN14957_c0_g1~~TRINITY_DN14957_c0_g1_i1.p2  ORF type:complete len:150 (+),score=50.18 TRINITY_DN14957_c0_g1_i1:56-505(+)
MKTGLCQFSGFKIYPGRGRRYVRVNSQSFTFVNQKAASAFLAKKNPRKLRWTQIYRRLHKGTSETEKKKKSRKTQKVQRAIVGASLEVIRQTRNQKPEVRAAARDAALREVKERQKAAAAKKAATKATTASATKAKPAVKAATKAAGKR